MISFRRTIKLIFHGHVLKYYFEFNFNSLPLDSSTTNGAATLGEYETKKPTLRTTIIVKRHNIWCDNDVDVNAF